MRVYLLEQFDSETSEILAVFSRESVCELAAEGLEATESHLPNWNRYGYQCISMEVSDV